MLKPSSYPGIQLVYDLSIPLQPNVSDWDNPQRVGSLQKDWPRKGQFGINTDNSNFFKKIQSAGWFD